MQISSISNNNPNFGHSFRVSICLKNENGLENIFVNPNTDKKLYKTLNSKIVNWLNEDYLANLRNLFGIQRKTSKREPYGDIHKKMAAELRTIDNDYALLSNVRSAYRKNQLGYIVTGIDVPIIENIKGIKQIGIAKADSKIYYGNTHTNYIKNLIQVIRGNILDYIQNDNVLLRSKNNKEIMLKTIFKQTGINKSGNPIYELDSYEFHENKTKRTLSPLSQAFHNYKYNAGMQNEIQNTVQNHLSKMLGKRTPFNDMSKVLNIKSQISQTPTQQAKKTIQKTVEKPVKPLAQEKPIQLKFDFKD